MDDKKRLDNSEELTMLVSLDVSRALKMNKISKPKAMNDSASDNELEYFNFENRFIGEEFDL